MCLRQWTSHLTSGLDSTEETWLYKASQTVGIVKNNTGIKNEKSLHFCIQYIFLWRKWLCNINLPSGESAALRPVTAVEVQIAALSNSYFWRCYLLESHKERDILSLGLRVFLSPWIRMCYRNDTKRKILDFIPSITGGLPWRWRQHSSETLISIYQTTRCHIPATGIEPEMSYCSSSVLFQANSRIVLPIINLPNPSSRTMALGSIQALTEMSTRNLPGGVKATGSIYERNVWKCGSLNLSQP
jgi:hypothetical protein